MKIERTVTISEYDADAAANDPREVYELRTGDGGTVTIRPLQFALGKRTILLTDLEAATAALRGETARSGRLREDEWADWQALAGELAKAGYYYRRREERLWELLKDTEYSYLFAEGALADERRDAHAALVRFDETIERS
jgi:hypothetical protein